MFKNDLTKNPELTRQTINNARIAIPGLFVQTTTDTAPTAHTAHVTKLGCCRHLMRPTCRETTRIYPLRKKLAKYIAKAAPEMPYRGIKRKLSATFSAAAMNVARAM